MLQARLLGAVGIVAVVGGVLAAHAGAPTVASRLTDAEFWTLVSHVSEPNGEFRSSNLLSNEPRMDQVIPDLTAAVTPGRAYLGVGPEQNFTYILATHPSIAFIFDIRRGNLDLHLMYKALFELSADRAEFVSRLFARPRPRGLDRSTSSAGIFAAYQSVAGSERLYRDTLAAIDAQLARTHGFSLSVDDLQGIAFVYHAFFEFGPALSYATYINGGGGGVRYPTYAELMSATDVRGVEHGFLSTEERFATVKDLEAKNLIVPVVGNFAGPTAIRAVGDYLKEKDTTVSAFYLSNVEDYLRQDGIWDTFCRNVATLPLDDTSTFIRTTTDPMSRGPGTGFREGLGVMAVETQMCR